jgi:salicylate hydroxylase
VSERGRVVIIGDAAHAMVPYLAQGGAAMSIEDGAALVECLERACGDRNLIPRALGAFESIRKPRCEIVQEASRGTGHRWHMPDGPEQQKRDQAMTASLDGRWSPRLILSSDTLKGR